MTPKPPSAMQLYARGDTAIRRAVESAFASLALNTRIAYTARVDAFLAWGVANHTPLTREGVARFLGTIPEASSANQALSALKRLANECAENGWLPWADAVAIGRLKSRKQAGVRTGHWLDMEQVKQMLAACDRTTLIGKRDAALLALLFGCGLRRAEACALTMEHLKG